MSEDKKLLQAQNIYEKLWKAFDRREFEYEKDGESLTVVCYDFSRSGLELTFNASVDSENSLIRFSCLLDIAVPHDKRIDMALCVNAANTCLFDGFFEYDIVEGNIVFCLSRWFDDCEINDPLLTELVYKSEAIIDAYYYDFVRLSNGEVSSEKLLEEIKERKLFRWSASEELVEAADEIFDTVIRAFEKSGYTVRGIKSLRMIYADISYPGLSSGMIIRVDADEQLISVIIPLTVMFREGTRIDGAVASCAVTDNLIAGGICSDYFSGSACFRITTSFLESKISERAIAALAEYACEVIKDYNPEFRRLNDGELDVSAFIC